MEKQNLRTVEWVREQAPRGTKNFPNGVHVANLVYWSKNKVSCFWIGRVKFVVFIKNQRVGTTNKRI